MRLIYLAETDFAFGSHGVREKNDGKMQAKSGGGDNCDMGRKAKSTLEQLKIEISEQTEQML